MKFLKISVVSLLDKFKLDLYLEHLEEASFLYEQRLSLLDDPEITWLDIEDFEERFEAHIDGLVVGEELALEVCRQQALEGDFGELHAAIRVFCRQKQNDLLTEILNKVDTDDPDVLKAISNALNDELPPGWQKAFVKLLQKKENYLTPIVAKLIGYRRIPAGEALLSCLEKANPENPIDFIWSLGRLKESKAAPVLFNTFLHHEDPFICREAALALLRTGDQKAVSYCREVVDSQDWAFLSLALGGGQKIVSVVDDQLRQGNINTNSLLAIGLLGDISCINILLENLSNPVFAESAALALNLVTGADIYEDVFIPEEIDEDELFEEELEKLKKGEALYSPGEEPGSTLNRLSQNPDSWQNWWQQNSSRFNKGVRYRNGKPCSPACLLENMQSERSPRIIRQYACEEFVIRYGVDFPFETEMSVRQQKKVLDKYKNWIENNNHHYQPGKYYFASHQIS